MKKEIRKPIVGIVLTIIGISFLSAYYKKEPNTANNDKQKQPALEVRISGKINHTTYTAGQKGTVSFNRFPSTVNEFKQVQQKIGGEPHGAVALGVMAIEMYRRNRSIGLECLKLSNTTTNVQPQVRQFNQLFGNDESYKRPYQMAAYLKGATPENGYNPTRPYTVEVIVDPVQSYQKSDMYQSTYLFLRILTKGKDSGSDRVRVLKTQKTNEPGEKGKFFIIDNNPGMSHGLKEKSFSKEFNGLK